MLQCTYMSISHMLLAGSFGGSERDETGLCASNSADEASLRTGSIRNRSNEQTQSFACIHKAGFLISFVQTWSLNMWTKYFYKENQIKSNLLKIISLQPTILFFVSFTSAVHKNFWG